jgi:hypothetical protein
MILNLYFVTVMLFMFIHVITVTNPQDALLIISV